MLEDAARRLAEHVASNAPAGWAEAVVAGRTGGIGASMSHLYRPPGNTVRRFRSPISFAEFQNVGEQARQLRGWEQTSIEIRCRATGEYRLVAFTETVTSRLWSSGGFLAVLDPDYRLPQPGRSQQAGTAPPVGDPELAVERFGEYLRKRAAILGSVEHLPPPVSEADLDDAERRIGQPLPADLRALYSIANGDAGAHGPRYLFGGNTWLSLQRLVDVYADHGSPVWFGWNQEWDAVMLDADPAETVRRCGAHPGWVPFADGEDGNYLAVDLAPAVNGRPGQVIGMGRDSDRGPTHFADSVTSLLGRYLSLLDQGDYELHDDHISVRERVRGAGPDTIIGDAIPDPSPATLQAVLINDAAQPVRLDPLAASPYLRRLHLNRCATADLAPIRELPVESLRVTLDGGDLAPLEGHLHLSSLELGTTGTVDIAPLTTAPNLRGLDLSRARVDDLTVLSNLHSLRYLVLTARQWTTLLDHDKPPPALAAACLADADASFDQALAWAASLGLDTEGAFRISGTL